MRISDWSSDVCSADLLGSDASFKRQYCRQHGLFAGIFSGEPRTFLVAVENMRANLRHALQRRPPTGRDIGGVIMGCRADLSRDAAADSLGGDSLALLPQAPNRRARTRPVACDSQRASGEMGRAQGRE